MNRLIAISKITKAHILNHKFIFLLNLSFITISLMTLFSLEILKKQGHRSMTAAVANIDLVVGAKSGEFELLLYSMFHIGNNTDSIPHESYTYLKEMSEVSWAIPLALGDEHRTMKVVGTNNDFFKKYLIKNKYKFTARAGELQLCHQCAVIGSTVAKNLKYQLGQKIIIEHAGSNANSHHHHPVTVSGILERSNTIYDQSILISLEDLAHMHHIEKSLDLSAVLVKLKNPTQILQAYRDINKQSQLKAILPSLTLSQIWRFVDMAQLAFKAMSLLIIIISILSLCIFITLYTMARTSEFILLRSLGVSKNIILALPIIEVFIMLLCSLFIATICTHICIAILNNYINLFGVLDIDQYWFSPEIKELIIIYFLFGMIICLAPLIQIHKRSIQPKITGV